MTSRASPSETQRDRLARARADVRRKMTGRLRDLLALLDADAWRARDDRAAAAGVDLDESALMSDGMIVAFDLARRRVASLLGMSEADIDARMREQESRWKRSRRRKPRAAVAYVQRRGLLASVTRKDTGEISAPGGRVEPRETYEQAVRRELREETGLEALSVRRVYGGGDVNGYRVACFVVDVAPDADLRAMEPGTEVAWVTPEELANGFGATFHRKALFAAGLLR